MNQYNSYYLYQQFEKRGNQDWIPCYPNIFSVDGDGTMPLVMKKENDPDCGYTGDTEPIYRWYPLPITTDYICDECPVVQYRWENMNPSTDYYCNGTTKHYKQIRQYSYDSGTTWYDVTPPEYRQGSAYEQQSTDCGYVPPIEPQYRTTSGTPYCEGVDKYVEVYSQVSYDGGITWSTTATTPTLVEHNSVDCGYVMYRWTKTDDVTCVEPQYQWNAAPQSDYICSGTSKYFKEYYDVSYDNGATWQHVEPEQTRRGNLIEANSPDCGFLSKLAATYSNGSTYRKACDDVRYLTSGETRPTGYTYSAMTSAAIGSCVRKIDDGGVFSGCTSLTSVTIPDSVTFIGNSAFTRCTSLTSVTIPNSVTEMGGFVFGNCSGLTSFVIPNSITITGGLVFGNCTSLTSCTIGTGLTTIEHGTFSGCTSLKRINSNIDGVFNIPNNVTAINGSVFGQCSGLTSVTIPSSVTYIGSSVFYRCRNLTSIDLPDSVTSIGYSVFSYCYGLTSVTIGSGLTSIGNEAFYYCTSLTSITITATTPPSLGMGVFNGTNSFTVYVLASAVDAYRSASGWGSHRIQPIT